MKSVPRPLRLPEVKTDVSVRGTLNVLLAARVESAVSYSGRLRRSMETRSGSRFGRTWAPSSPHAASQLAGEVFCRAWWLSYGVPTVAPRYFNVYRPRPGPDKRVRGRSCPGSRWRCLSGEAPVIHGDGEQARDFAYIHDVVEANLLTAYPTQASCARVVNVAGGARPRSVNELLEMIAD